MADEEKHFWGTITQKALIEQDGKILVLECPANGKAAGKFDLPGGRLHEGETPLMGLEREVFEEIGAEVDVGPAIATGTMVNLSNIPNFFVIYQTKLKNPGQQFVLQPEEVESIQWFDSKDFFTRPIIYPKYQEALKAYWK